MSNSVRDNMSKEDIVSEIKLSIGADIKKEYTYLLVEGSDDIKFWRGITSEKVLIFESFSGKNGIKEIVEEFFDTNPQVIGIRDKDYESKVIHNRIYYYDYCCMEMMFICSTDAFNSIYTEYYDGEIPVNELKEKILHQLKILSHIRKLNETKDWGIKINGISINSAFNRETKELVIDTIITKLNEMNRNFFIHKPEERQCLDDLLMNESTTNELLNITQGHDFLKLFSTYCMKDQGNSISDINISASLRCSYRKSDFEKSLLYFKLVEHEERYKLKIVS
ncbi:hypothetical protein [Paenibacillus sp. FSL H8-0168]|uniref:hypothetical protein n=1 Tax=Paenibacillus sp. FSL H8-0168 TaxID=2921378 RepID=UPI003158E28F